MLNSPDRVIAARAALDLEQDAALLDALGQGTEAVVVVHVGGVYGDRASALDRWAAALSVFPRRRAGASCLSTTSAASRSSTRSSCTT